MHLTKGNYVALSNSQELVFKELKCYEKSNSHGSMEMSFFVSCPIRNALPVPDKSGHRAPCCIIFKPALHKCPDLRGTLRLPVKGYEIKRHLHTLPYSVSQEVYHTRACWETLRKTGLDVYNHLWDFYTQDYQTNVRYWITQADLPCGEFWTSTGLVVVGFSISIFPLYHIRYDHRLDPSMYRRCRPEHLLTTQGQWAVKDATGIPHYGRSCGAPSCCCIHG